MKMHVEIDLARDYLNCVFIIHAFFYKHCNIFARAQMLLSKVKFSAKVPYPT